MSIVGADRPDTIQGGREIVLTMSREDYIHELETIVVYLADWSGYLQSGCALDLVRDQIRHIKAKRAD